MIVALLLAAFVAWHFIPEAKPPGPSPKFRPEPRAKADDPRWKRFIEAHCESPAETAFLTAMIDAYKLVPEGGSLRAEGIKLDFQVEEGRYRVDFLANEWLVIEIDGAAYHSSPEAQARDRTRDLFFEGLGYRVLRIPAKAVFSKPEEAIERVRSAIARGKPQISAPESVSGFTRLGRTMAGLNNALETINDTVARQRAIEIALREPREAFSKEKMVINIEIETAKLNLEIEDRLAKSPELKREYDRMAPELGINSEEGEYHIVQVFQNFCDRPCTNTQT